MQDLTPTQVKNLLDESDSPPTLLDVREANEFAYARIEGALHIPMQTIPDRLKELNPDASYVVLCHHGMRSRMVGDFLESRGFTQIANLRGGIDAWSTEIDASIPRY
jgi:rhodanese-related sulfurtransferase